MFTGDRDFAGAVSAVHSNVWQLVFVLEFTRQKLNFVLNTALLVHLGAGNPWRKRDLSAGIWGVFLLFYTSNPWSWSWLSGEWKESLEFHGFGVQPAAGFQGWKRPPKGHGVCISMGLSPRRGWATSLHVSLATSVPGSGTNPFLAAPNPSGTGNEHPEFSLRLSHPVL